MYLPDRFEEYCSEAALPFGVSPAVHPADFMLRRFIEDPHCVGAPRSAAEGYFSDGNSCATRFESVVYDTLGFSRGRPLSILEFASGYGRVSRHLPRRFPNATIVAADIHPAAVQFTQEQFGIASVLSPAMPEQFAVAGEFDVVLALSFFTHMPPTTFGPWLGALYKSLKRGGFLVFTTSGRKPFALGGRDPDLFDQHNAYFVPNSEQLDIDFAQYGTMWVLPGYVVGEVWNHTRAPIAVYEENFWWGLQDMYVITKP